MSTIRAFINKKRVSTGRQITPSTFQQFFPENLSFKDEKEWMDNVNHLCGADVVFQSKDRALSVVASPVLENVPTNTNESSSSPLLDEKNWKFDSHLKQRLPAGKYWIGDICYCLSDELYDKVFGGVGGYDGGLYTHKDGGFFMVDSTAYGDGCYEGSDGFGYGVDAGIIGIISEQLIDMRSSGLSGGKIHVFDKPVTCNFKGGVFTFHSGYDTIEINTCEDDI